MYDLSSYLNSDLSHFPPNPNHRLTQNPLISHEVSSNNAGKLYLTLTLNALIIEVLDNAAKEAWLKLLKNAVDIARQEGIQKVLICSRSANSMMDQEQINFVVNRLPIELCNAGVQYACIVPYNDEAGVVLTMQIAKAYNQYLTTNHADSIKSGLQWLKDVTDY